jgi:aspartate carbamoyltransferase catalytic subunit
VQKGESLIDTGKTLDALQASVMVIRHFAAGAPKLLADNVSASVINAGDGMNEHPTQALLDMFTLQEKYGSIEGLTVAIVGDIKHSRVARSNVWGLTKMGAQVRFCAPATLIPPEFERTGAEVFGCCDEAVKGADAIMALRMQLERENGMVASIREYHKYFGIDRKRMSLAAKGAILMHPGPINRGVELSSEMADSAESVIEEQVLNGVAVRMALLFLLTRGGKK